MGIIFDKNLSWITHINDIGNKIGKCMIKLMHITKATWGLKPTVVKTLYTTVIEKVVLYACGIWYNKK